MSDPGAEAVAAAGLIIAESNLGLAEQRLAGARDYLRRLRKIRKGDGALRPAMADGIVSARRSVRARRRERNLARRQLAAARAAVLGGDAFGWWHHP